MVDVPLASAVHGEQDIFLIGLWVSFSINGGVRFLAKGVTVASKTCLTNNAEKLTVAVNIKLKYC